MLNLIGEREKNNSSNFSEGDLSESETDSRNLRFALLIVGIVIILGLFVGLIIFGFIKYFKKDKDEEKEYFQTIKSSNPKEPSKVSVNVIPEIVEATPEVENVSEVPIPVKMRKRSMTFSETDEECRKYREGLANSYELEQEPEENKKQPRKVSVVTFQDSPR